MSSFVIGKMSYMRCAGVIVGISNALYREPLWIFNYKEYRNFNESDYINAFKWLYYANAKSVQLQYKDPTMEADTDDYIKEFNEYKKIGKQAVYNNDLVNIVSSIYEFLNSVKYQIEDENLSYKANYFINLLLAELTHKTIASRHDIDCWGSFEIKKPAKNVEVIGG